jgi:predicted dehydrogenase
VSFTICSVGCGRLATEMHGPSLALYRSRHPGTVLAACCDLDPEKAARFRESFGYDSCSTDLGAMLDAVRPDAVNLVVRPSATAGVAIRVLERSLPVIMEKPPGRSPEETRSIIAAASRAGIPTRVAFNRRYMLLSARLAGVLADAPGAGIDHIHCDFYRVGRTDADFSTTAIHAIDMVRWLAGCDYRTVRINRGRARPGPLVDDLFLDCTLDSEATARITFCPASGVSVERVVVNARDFSAVAELPGWEPEDPPESLTCYRNGRVSVHLARQDFGEPAGPFERLGFCSENAGFFDDLRAGRRPVGGVEDSLQSVQIAAAVRAGAAYWGEEA